jgi:hypothetical protein
MNNHTVTLGHAQAYEHERAARDAEAQAPEGCAPLFSNAAKPGSILYEREQRERELNAARERVAAGGGPSLEELIEKFDAVREKMQVGDVHSTARGSGARFNAGKVPFDLIPLRIVALSYDIDPPLSGELEDARRALESLGEWQETGESDHLFAALGAMGLAGWSECAQVFAYGRKKYAAWNWAKGMNWSIPLACAARHLMQILDGEDTDAESGLPHRGHVFCNVVMLLTFEHTFPEGDDRPRLLATPATTQGAA